MAPTQADKLLATGSDATFHDKNFHALCSRLARSDRELAQILKVYGFPPMWTRPASFATLVLIILEQQVSLASAYAAFSKLKQSIGRITPAKLLAMSDADLRACYFSRQKIAYARGLAAAIQKKHLQLGKLSLYSDHEVKQELIKLKGIGEWTADVYLIHAMQRTDLFPIGDIALVNSMKEVKNLPKDTSKEKLLKMAEIWRPYRTIAAMMLWHAYIRKRGIKIIS